MKWPTRDPNAQFMPIKPPGQLSAQEHTALVQEKASLGNLPRLPRERRRLAEINQLLAMHDAAAPAENDTAPAPDPLEEERRQLLDIVKRNEQRGDDWAGAAKAQARIREIDRIIKERHRQRGVIHSDKPAPAPTSDAAALQAAERALLTILNRDVQEAEAVAKKYRRAAQHAATATHSGGGDAQYMPVKPYYEQ